MSIADGELAVDSEMTLPPGTTVTDTNVEIPAGTTLTFRNDSDSAANLSSDDGAIDTEIEPGDTYEYTFEDTGTWTLMLDDEEAMTVTVN